MKTVINKSMLIAGFSYIILFILFIMSKSIFPDARGGWSNPPIFDHLFLFSLGICILVISLGYTYFAWTLNEKEYVDWYLDQQLIGRKWTEKWISLFPDGHILWIIRIVAPIGALFGAAMFSIMLIAIIKFLWKG